MNTNEERWLFLDDVRNATPERWDIVRSYNAFVKYLQTQPVPPVISFDHDLGIEHYPTTEQSYDDKIDYSSYKEKTGYDAALWAIENDKLPKIALVHSYNIVGARNIARVLIEAGVETILAPYAVMPYGATKEIG